MTKVREHQRNYEESNRPEIALITNHGYAGINIPVGGATDTGGQNFYVNTFANKLERLGYRITIFTRGGFSHFQSDKRREHTEYGSDFIRYVYVEGGGSAFLRKEDIAIALDEEVEWLDEFVRGESDRRSCHPWEVYEFINSHYWDAGVIASRLAERWCNDVVADAMAQLLKGIVSPDEMDELHKLRHVRAIGAVPGFHLGRMLIHHFAIRHETLQHQVRAAVSAWSSVRRLGPKAENELVDQVMESVNEHSDADAPMRRLIAADALGREILVRYPEIDERIKRQMDRVNCHVWTPHSLGELKDFNYRDRPREVRRSLKFCERRNHERAVTNRAHAFVATSAKIADRLWVHYRVSINDTFYFPPCIDCDVFRARDASETESTYTYLSNLLNLDADRLKRSPIVFETSRMDSTKRKDLVISAFSSIAAQHPDALLLIGGGPANDIFAALQQQLDDSPELKDRAFLLNAIPEQYLASMFSIADVYASASEMEGFGMSVSQAAASHTAIVSSDLIPFSLHHAAKHAIIVPAGDTDAFAVAMDRLLSDDVDRKRRALELVNVARTLDWESKTSSFIAYLRDRGFDIAAGTPT